MKKIFSFAIMLLMVATTFLLSGCLPPNYSDKKVKEIAKEHQKDAVAWFSHNMPEAKPDSDCEAYHSGVDLYGAVKGSYKHKGKEYKYVFDYHNKKMYVEEGYKESCQIIKQRVLQAFGFKEAESEVSFHGYSFTLLNENDDVKPRAKQFGGDAKFLGSPLEKLVPALKTPAQIADMMLAPDTKERFDFYVSVYKEEYPEHNQKLHQSFKNLGGVWYHKLIDLDNEPQGICTKVYSKNGQVKNSRYHVAKIEDGLYGGYLATKELKDGKFVDKLNVIKKDSKNFTLEIPQYTSAIFFSKDNKYLVHHFKNSSNNLIENVADDMFKRSCPGNKSYNRQGVYFAVKDNFSHAYESKAVSFVKGRYDIKMLGMLDLDYWKLKFFD